MLMSAVARVKPYLRWLALGAALFFLLATLRQHWQALMAIQLTDATWAGLVMALGVTLLAHIWSGWVWLWIVQSLGIQVRGLWTMAIYLKTNIAKYLPGNVWHFYGRVRALQAAGATSFGATTGVLLEPVFMAAAALILAALGSGMILPGGLRLGLLGVLVALLAGLHPRLFNPLLAQINPASQPPSQAPPIHRLQHYPLKPLVGELGFIILRGLGFALVLTALQPLAWPQLLPILSAFAIAWLLGLVIPGAPGGIGVFEAVAVALLQAQLPAAQVLSGVIGYRLVSTLAEAIGAGLIWLDHPSRGLAIGPAAPALLLPAPASVSPPTASQPTFQAEPPVAPPVNPQTELQTELQTDPQTVPLATAAVAQPPQVTAPPSVTFGPPSPHPAIAAPADSAEAEASHPSSP